jgi:hypothetical protein
MESCGCDNGSEIIRSVHRTIGNPRTRSLDTEGGKGPDCLLQRQYLFELSSGSDAPYAPISNGVDEQAGQAKDFRRPVRDQRKSL